MYKRSNISILRINAVKKAMTVGITNSPAINKIIFLLFPFYLFPRCLLLINATIKDNRANAKPKYAVPYKTFSCRCSKEPDKNPIPKMIAITTIKK